MQTALWKYAQLADDRPKPQKMINIFLDFSMKYNKMHALDDKFYWK